MRVALTFSHADFTIGFEADADGFAREKLLDKAMGVHRRRKTSEKLRAGRRPMIALIARASSGAVIGTVRLWRVKAGDLDALLLGPLAVAASHRGLGMGGRLIARAITLAKALGERAIFLVGDPEYYGRFGFFAKHAQKFSMPGPFERRRFLGLEIVGGALATGNGVLRASGEKATQRLAKIIESPTSSILAAPFMQSPAVGDAGNDSAPHYSPWRTKRRKGT